MTRPRHLLDHPVIAQRYFFPRPDALREPTWVEVQGARLACYATAPHGPEARTLLHFHGNGECVADYVPELAALFTGLGFNLFLAEYRGYGESTGQPGLASMLDDAEALVKATGVEPSRLVIMGRSVGSLYALHAASRTPGIAGLVIESGIANVYERIALRVQPEELGCDEITLRSAIHALFDHPDKIAAVTAPILLLHAVGDHLVGIHHARTLERAARAPCTLEALPRGDHNTILFANLERYRQALGRFAG